MNILEIIIIVLILVMALVGYWRGFVKKIAGMVSLVLSITLVSAVLPYMTDFLQTTPVYDYIVRQCRQVVSENIPYGQPTRIQQTELIENLALPETMKDALLDYNNEEGYRSFGVTTFQDYIDHYIAKAILNVLSFVAAVLLVQLAIRLLMMTLDILANLPLIGGVNHILGMLLGLIQALFLIWVFFLILAMMTTTETGLMLMSMVQQSRILSYLYNSNLFMQIVLRTAAVFTIRG